MEEEGGFELEANAGEVVVTYSKDQLCPAHKAECLHCLLEKLIQNVPIMKMCGGTGNNDGSADPGKLKEVLDQIGCVGCFLDSKIQ